MSTRRPWIGETTRPNESATLAAVLSTRARRATRSVWQWRARTNRRWFPVGSCSRAPTSCCCCCCWTIVAAAVVVVVVVVAQMSTSSKCCYYCYHCCGRCLIDVDECAS